MRPFALFLTFGFALPGAALAGDAGLAPLTQAYESAGAAVTAAAKVRRFTLEYGTRGSRWVLRPDTSPPGSSLTIWVDEGDSVVLDFVKYPNSRDTSVDIDGLDALVDGRPVNGVHLDFRGLGFEEHRVEFTPKKEGMLLLYSRWSSRPGHWGTIIVRKKKG